MHNCDYKKQRGYKSDFPCIKMDHAGLTALRQEPFLLHFSDQGRVFWREEQTAWPFTLAVEKSVIFLQRQSKVHPAERKHPCS